jgi:hypothetical protein
VSVEDYRINAEVRRYLVSRWVDVSRLQLGATNGVVYVMGYLDTVIGDPHRHADRIDQRPDAERALRLAMTIDKELRRIPLVRDVVFKLENVFKRGGRWRSIERGQEARQVSESQPLARKTWRHVRGIDEVES